MNLSFIVRLQKKSEFDLSFEVSFDECSQMQMESRKAMMEMKA